jgi:tetratricopeptide (TPR) repeat protein
LWDLTGGEKPRVLSGHESPVYMVSFSPDGSTLASAGQDGTAKIWNTATGQVVQTLKGHKGEVFVVAFSPAGKWVATAGWDRTVRVWDVATGKEAFPPREHTGRIYSINFDRDGRRLVSASTDGSMECVIDFDNRGVTSQPSRNGTIRVWEPATSHDVMTVRGQPGIIYGVALSPDGRRVASTLGQALTIWDVESGLEVLTLTGHRGPAHGVAFSPDGRHLASTAGDGRLVVWDASPVSRDELRRQADEAHNLGQLLRNWTMYVQAEDAYRDAIAQLARLVEEDPADTVSRRKLGDCNYRLGLALMADGRRRDSEAAYRAALAVREHLAAAFPADPQYRQALGQAFNDLGRLGYHTGDPKLAEEGYRRALEIREKLVAEFPAEAQYGVDLGGTCCNRGHVLSQSLKQAKASLEWYERAARALAPWSATNATARQFLLNTHEGRASALAELERYADAVTDFDRAAELSGGQPRPPIRLRRADALARAGHHARAFAEANVLAALNGIGGDTMYDLACICSLAAAAGKTDARRAEEYAARAIALLVRAQGAKFFADPRHVAHLEKDSDIDPLRQRADYHVLLTELKKPQKR